jgi:two-component system chemotaxis response regulator CheB
MMTIRPEAIVIGASAGALEALSVILPALPADFALPLMVVVHVPPDRRSMLAELFQAKCRIAVLEAGDKEPINGGTAYFAPPNYHLLVEASGCLSLSSDEAVLFSRPSIDVLFESAADAYGAGLRAVMDAGGTAIVQMPKSAYASAMPEAAIATCPSAHVMSLDAILLFLQEVNAA